MKSKKNVVLLDKLLKISLKDLRDLNLLNSGYRSLEVIFRHGSRKDNDMPVIRISTSIEAETSQRELEFMLNGSAIVQHIQLMRVKNNLPNSLSWCFICPVTKVRCRKLHFHDIGFLHKSGIPNARYIVECLTANKRWAFKSARRIQRYHRIIENRGKKYFKARYSGKFTRTQLRVIIASREIKKLTISKE